VFCENLNNTPFYVDINFISKNKSQDAKAQLSEPAGPPVDIILWVDQEVGILSSVSSKSASIFDWLELLDVLDENEYAQREDVQVEGEHLKG